MLMVLFFLGEVEQACRRKSNRFSKLNFWLTQVISDTKDCGELELSKGFDVTFNKNGLLMKKI